MTPRGPIPWHRWLLFGAIAAGGTAFDLYTKRAIFAWVGPPHDSAPHVLVPNILELRTSYNPGALWGLGARMPHGSTVFAFLSLAAVAAICYWLFVRCAAVDLRLTVAFGLITAGALGNGYDRLVLGQVRDFVYFHVDSIRFQFAIFNFADNMLVAGAILLLWMALRPDPVKSVETDAPDGASAEAQSLHQQESAAPTPG
jgi:signal peptidase II